MWLYRKGDTEVKERGKDGTASPWRCRLCAPIGLLDGEIMGEEFGNRLRGVGYSPPYYQRMDKVMNAPFWNGVSRGDSSENYDLRHILSGFPL